MLRHSSYIGKLLLNRYEVQELLGEGGMGQVFRVWDRQGRETRAIKLVDTRKRKFPLETVLRFKAEAETLKSLQHPSIVQYIDFFNEDDVYALVMEYLPHPTLAQSLEKHGPLPICAGLDVFYLLTEALLFIHEKKRVHHDLKSSNIILDLSDEATPKVKLLDFGFAQLVGAAGDSVGGTLAYMAPEQTGILHKMIDHRADLYSLGVILYELLTGRVPFTSEDPAILMHQHIAQAPEPPSHLRADLPPLFEQIILKLLSKDPEDRYRTTVGLYKDLEKYMRIANEQESYEEILFTLGEEDHWDSFPQVSPFVGRGKELNGLERVVHQTLDFGKGGFLLLEGARGMGKTALLQEFSNRLQPKGGAFWFTQPRKEETNIPFKFLKNLLQYFVSYLKNLRENEQYIVIQYFQKLFGAKFVRLLELIPELSSWTEAKALPALPSATTDELEKDYQEIIQEFLKRVVQHSKRLIILIDDLPHVEPASTRALFRLLDSLHEMPVLLICSYHFADLSAEQREAIKHAMTRPDVYRVVIDPLREANVAELLLKLFSNKLDQSHALLGPLYAATQGNPSQLRRLLQNLIDQKLIFYRNRAWHTDFTKTLTLIKNYSPVQAQQKSITEWSPMMRLVLGRGAPFQRAFLLDALRATLQAPPALEDISETELFQVLDEAVQNEILSVDSQRLYAFRDQSIRQALLDGMTLETKQAIHRAIALFLEARILPEWPESIYDIALHWGRSGDSKKAIQYYLKAARHTDDGMFYNRQSQFYYNLALETLRTLEPDQISVEMHFEIRYLALQYNFSNGNQFDKLWQDLQELEPWIQGDHVRLMKSLRIKSALSFFLGRKADFFKYAEELLELGKAPEHEEHTVAIYNLMGRVASEKSYQERAEMLKRGMELAYRHGMYLQVLQSMSILVVILAYLGRFKEAEQQAQYFTELLLQKQYTPATVSFHFAMTALETERGDFPKVLEHSQKIWDFQEELGGPGRTFFRMRLALAQGMQGYLKEALETIEEYLQNKEKLEQQVTRSTTLFVRIQIALHHADPETALHYLEEAQNFIQIRADSMMEAMFAIQAAFAYLQLNQLASATQALEEIAAPIATRLQAPLLNLHLNFAQAKLRWMKTKDRQFLEAGREVLREMLTTDMTGYYEIYKEDHNHWSRYSSDSSSQLSSNFKGNMEMLQLLEINRQITSTLDTQTLLATVLAGAMQISGAEQGYLFLCEANCQMQIEENVPKLHLTRDAQGQGIPPEKHVYSVSVLRAVVKSLATVVTRDARHERRWALHPSIQTHQLRSILAAPIMMQGQVKGILYLDNHHASSVFTTKDREIVDIFATQVAIAMNNAQVYAAEQKARQQTEATLKIFERFVPRQFTKQIAAGDIRALETGLARQAQLSILFSDIRGFTSVSEKMLPAELFKFLNAYLRRMEAPIRRWHGYVDKFIGDAIMALFDTSASDAIDAALDMQATLSEYNQTRLERGFQPLKIGIGINSGDVMVGVVGSEERMDTTVLGDAVNLASRVESLTKYYGCTLLITDNTYEQVRQKPGLLVRFVDAVRVKGKQKASVLYEVYNDDPPELRTKKQQYGQEFEHALTAYQAGAWPDAERLFNEYARLIPEDPAAMRFIQRCQTFQHMPPSHWTGVYDIENK